MTKSILKSKITLGKKFISMIMTVSENVKLFLYSDAGMLNLLTIMVQLLLKSLLWVAIGAEILIWYLILMCYF